jgi:ribosomal-protein-serine acetyltransferase
MTQATSGFGCLLVQPHVCLQIHFMQTIFTDGRIGIRPYRDNDVDAMFAAASESARELSAWMAWYHAGYARTDSEAFVRSRAAEWEKGEQYSFVIHDAGTGQFLGGVGLNFINRLHRFANLGYWVRTGQTRRSVATTATRLMARFGFEELGFNRLEIVVATGNAASQRVAEKVGARREGVLRKRLVLRDQAHDAVMFSLVPEDLARVA